MYFIFHIIIYLKHVKEQNGLTPSTKQKMAYVLGFFPEKKWNTQQCNDRNKSNELQPFCMCVCMFTNLKWRKLSAEKMEFIKIIRMILAFICVYPIYMKLRNSRIYSVLLCLLYLFLAIVCWMKNICYCLTVTHRPEKSGKQWTWW